MLSAISYLNPWADKGTLRDLNKLETWQKAAAVASTALESIAVIYLASYAGLALCIGLPVTALCAIAIFRVVVAFAASRIPTPPPAPITVLPSIEGMNAAQIKKAVCERKVRELLLLPNQDLGKAIDNGDCFYDAIAQLLRSQGVDATVQSLRKDIHEALSHPRWRKHLQEKVEQDPRGIGSFEDYCRDVGKSAQQMGKQGPIWGDASREGVILCDKYNFNLRVLQAGLIEGSVLGDAEITMFKGLKEFLQKHEPSSPLIASHEANFQARFRELCNLAANYYTLVQTVPKTSYPVMLTIALFGDHFVPVVTR